MLSEYGREFNDARKRQGFKSQEHLDAFYKWLDHARNCPTCSSVYGYVWLSDGPQPYMDRCEKGKQLDKEQSSF